MVMLKKWKLYIIAYSFFFVYLCIGMKEEGIFRLAGSKEKAENIRGLIDAGKEGSLEEMSDDVHCIAGLLKQYLRELPQPLIYGKAHKRLHSIKGIV